MGEPPPGTSLALRLLAKVGRGLLLSSYARAYKHHASEPIDPARLQRWEIVNLAVRLIDGLPGERPRLLQRLRRQFARGDAS
jgi:hypothetical protein